MVSKEFGHLISDRSFVIAVQHLVDNRRIGTRLINHRWRLVRLSDRDGTFVLSDSPLVRLPDRDIWILPLGPRAALTMVPPSLFLQCEPAHRFAKRLNVASAGQARKFVFSVERSHARWLRRYLAPGEPAHF